MQKSTVTEPLYIVFYGTLKVGSEQFKARGLDRFLSFVGDCEIQGDLYDIEEGDENYPALVPGNGTVRAQLFEIRDPSFLAATDRYEEIDPDNPENSLYLRKAIHLKKPDVDAWCYVYNQSVANRPKIVSGDWSLYLNEKQAALSTPRQPPARKFGN